MTLNLLSQYMSSKPLSIYIFPPLKTHPHTFRAPIPHKHVKPWFLFYVFPPLRFYAFTESSKSVQNAQHATHPSPLQNLAPIFINNSVKNRLLILLTSIKFFDKF